MNDTTLLSNFQRVSHLWYLYNFKTLFHGSSWFFSKKKNEKKKNQRDETSNDTGHLHFTNPARPEERHVRPRSTSRRDHVAKVATREREREREAWHFAGLQRVDQEANRQNATERRAENARDDRDYSRLREFVVSLIESPRFDAPCLANGNFSPVVLCFVRF